MKTKILSFVLATICTTCMTAFILNMNTTMHECQNNHNIATAFDLSDIEEGYKELGFTIETRNEYKYAYREDVGSFILRYYGYDSNVEIPNQIDDMDIIGIGYGSFACNLYIKSVSLPSKVWFIDPYAFYQCERLENISLPDSLREITEYAFYGCLNLESIIIPKNVEFIKSDAFGYCKNLRRIAFYNSDTYIANDGIWNDLLKYEGTIYGYSGSDVNKYANSNRIQFREIEYYEKDMAPLTGTYLITTSNYTTTSNTSSIKIEAQNYDANGDNITTISDAIILSRYLSEDSTLSNEFTKEITTDKFDLDKDGYITVIDLCRILEFIAGIN